MATKTGEMREMLISCIEDVRAGKLDAADAKSISALAAQINGSLQVEFAFREAEANLARQKIGSMLIGEEA